MLIGRLAHKLRGWVHRHEAQQTKPRRMSNSNPKPTRTILVCHSQQHVLANRKTSLIGCAKMCLQESLESKLNLYLRPLLSV